MSMVRAIYENGVFRPTGPVELPERAEVEFEPRVVGEAKEVPTLEDVYAILSERYESGDPHGAGRHNEHQP